MQTYIVKKGDTFSGIARRHKVTIKTLRRANPRGRADAGQPCRKVHR
jgi:LysM repeat protein